MNGDPLLADMMMLSKETLAPVGLRNIELGLIGQVLRARLRRVAKRDALTTILPISLPG